LHSAEIAPLADYGKHQITEGETMEQQHKRESQRENQEDGTTTGHSRVSYHSLLEMALMVVVALVGLVVFGTLASIVPAVVVMVGELAVLPTLLVVVPYVTVRVVTAVLKRREAS
jgi:hypothetical protein